jgi:hypothetical protein
MAYVAHGAFHLGRAESRESAQSGGRETRSPHLDLLYRDEIIAAAVFFLVVEGGLHPSRTRRLTSPIPAWCNSAITTKKKRSESACSIVAKALEEVGIHMVESNVAA